MYTMFVCKSNITSKTRIGVTKYHAPLTLSQRKSKNNYCYLTNYNSKQFVLSPFSPFQYIETVREQTA